MVEASAGTGKTFAIAHLYLRLLLERDGDAALAPGEILVVTYTRAATAELRARIRRRLLQARACIDGVSPGDGFDPALEELMQRYAADRERISRRLAACAAEMDDASIFTIHGFCERVLREAAFDSGADFERELVEQPRVLVADVVLDRWVAGLAQADPDLVAALTERTGQLGQVRRLVEIALQNPGARLVPAAPPVVDLGAAREAVARAAGALRPDWEKERDGLRALLVAARDRGDLNRNSLRDGRLDQVFRDLDGVAIAGEPVLSPKALDAIRCITPGGLRTNGDRPAPSHPLMDRIEAWLVATRALLAARAGARLRFLHDLVDGAREALALRLRASGLYTFDDLLRDVWTALRGPGGAALAARIRERYPVALVDEFQDTDPHQYEIFRRVYHEAGAPLVLIGDPKQSIYSFRGADVHAYVRARADAGERVRRLSVCYRSDPGVVGGVQALFGGAEPFGSADIGLDPVETERGKTDELEPAFELLALRPGPAEDLVEAAAAATAAEIARRVADDAIVPDRIAVLCRTNAQARAVADALRPYHLPAVMHGDTSVFETAAAVDVERIARALAQPGNAAAVRAALATRLLGACAERLARLAGDAPAWDRAVERLGAARALQERGGFSVALRDLVHDLDLEHRERPAVALLEQVGGERYLTDVLHLADLAHAEERRMHLGPLALAQWIGRMRIDEAARAGQALEDTQIRIESDAHAVCLTTVHRAKGLEFDLVYVPYAWRSDEPPANDPWRAFHDGERRCISLDGSHAQQAKDESMREALRLLYVAVTRARHYCGLVCVPGEMGKSALGQRMEALDVSDPLPGRGPIPVRELEPTAPVPPAFPTGAPELEARALARPVPAARRTSSFSGLIAGADGPPEEGRDRDPARQLPPESPAERGERVALAGFPRGTRAGSLVHAIYEHLDFATADRESVGLVTDAAIRSWGLGAEQRDVLVDAVLGTVETPLPGGGPRLRDLAATDCRDELEFVLPVGDPGRPEGWLRPRALADVLERHAEHPRVRAYAARVADLRFASLAGHLRGFIDLVFRHGERWYLADYKTTWLGDHVDDYAPARVEASIFAHDHALQYHLYTVALHRHLRARLPGYDPAWHLGGVYYLYVRGMSPAHPPGHGVFLDRPPVALIEALSAALERPGEAAA